MDPGLHAWQVSCGRVQAPSRLELTGVPPCCPAGPDGSGAATPLLSAMSPLGTGAGSDLTPLRQLPPELMHSPDTPCDPACVVSIAGLVPDSWELHALASAVF